MPETRRGLRSNWRLKRLLTPTRKLSDVSHIYMQPTSNHCDAGRERCRVVLRPAYSLNLEARQAIEHAIRNGRGR